MHFNHSSSPNLVKRSKNFKKPNQLTVQALFLRKKGNSELKRKQQRDIKIKVSYDLKQSTLGIHPLTKVN